MVKQQTNKNNSNTFLLLTHQSFGTEYFIWLRLKHFSHEKLSITFQLRNLIITINSKNWTRFRHDTIQPRSQGLSSSRQKRLI